MMLKATIYHNEKCSKSNAALNLLLENNIETKVVNYLETPLSAELIQHLSSMLGIEAKALIRFEEPLAKELLLSKEDIRDDPQWIAFMVDHPVLIERPVVVIDDKAVIGRPPELVLTLIA